MTKAKTQYTPEQEQQLTELWAAGKGKTVAELAEHFGKPNASIIAKLSRMGIYVKPESPETEKKSKAITKDALATQLGESIGLDEGSTDSLTKANKTALLAILETIESLRSDLEEYEQDGDIDPTAANS